MTCLKQLTRSRLLNISSAITRERVALENQWTHPRIQKKRIWPNVLKKGTFTLKFIEKNAIFYFPGETLWQYCKKFKNFFSRYSVSFSKYFLFCTTSETPNNKKIKPKWVIVLLERKMFVWKIWAGQVILDDITGAWKNTMGSSSSSCKSN